LFGAAETVSITVSSGFADFAAINDLENLSGKPTQKCAGQSGKIYVLIKLS
jgi:hypothetical protein